MSPPSRLRSPTDHLSYAPEVGADFPDLVTGLVLAEGLSVDALTGVDLGPYHRRALDRLGAGSESDLPQIQAWRRAFAARGLRPTRYRCAAEALLRRLRRDGALPSLNPLVDLANAISVATALPVAALDLDRVTGPLVVRRATGEETYESFGGDHEHPDRGEVVFADASGHAHARRWTHRQSARSAVGAGTVRTLVVVEAQHGDARPDVQEAVDLLHERLAPAARLCRTHVS